MTHEEWVAAKRRELVVLAQSMLVGEVHLIEGVRRLCNMRFDVGDPDNELFLALRSIDSDTDDFPLGEMRKQCSAEFLKRKDIEMQNYLDGMHNDIRCTCIEIIRRFTER
jgi:hypothetical protein